MVQALFDLQLSSIKHYNIATFVPDVKVHYIVHRYAQLTSSLLSLNADYQVHTAPLLDLSRGTVLQIHYTTQHSTALHVCIADVFFTVLMLCR